MICARRVFRCFRRLERFADRITGAAGPWFVALAIILISLGSLSFCKLTLAFTSGLSCLPELISHDRAAHFTISMVDNASMHPSRSKHVYALLLRLHHFAWLHW